MNYTRTTTISGTHPKKGPKEDLLSDDEQARLEHIAKTSSVDSDRVWARMRLLEHRVTLLEDADS